jgi:hypothetical protein
LVVQALPGPFILHFLFVSFQFLHDVLKAHVSYPPVSKRHRNR